MKEPSERILVSGLLGLVIESILESSLTDRNRKVCPVQKRQAHLRNSGDRAREATNKNPKEPGTRNHK